MLIDAERITGLVLAGGRGSRMGGVDKGLQPFKGVPLAQYSLQRLRPQVGPVLLNANRNLATYAAFGVPVHADEAIGDESFAGPLAGFLAGLQHCETPYLVTVPCDTPRFPHDLVARLAARLEHDQADIAMAASPKPDRPDGRLEPQPVFCLMHTQLRDSLARFVGSGGRKVQDWTAQHSMVLVPFTEPQDDAWAFFNANTIEELDLLETESTRALPRSSIGDSL